MVKGKQIRYKIYLNILPHNNFIEFHYNEPKLLDTILKRAESADPCFQEDWFFSSVALCYVVQLLQGGQEPVVSGTSRPAATWGELDVITNHLNDPKPWNLPDMVSNGDD